MAQGKPWEAPVFRRGSSHSISVKRKVTVPVGKVTHLRLQCVTAGGPPGVQQNVR